MSSKRYPEEFKIEAVRQVVERGHSVAEVASRLGMTTHSLYSWKLRYGPRSDEQQAKTSDEMEIKELKKELKRVTEERDILKKPRCTSPTSPNEVRLYQGQQRDLAGQSTVRSAGCSSQWLLRVAQAASFSSGKRESASDWVDQTVLAGKWWRVWLP